MNTTTAVGSPTPLRGSGDQIIVSLPSTVGTYYLSNFSLVTMN
jgi:hypothetical protein